MTAKRLDLEIFLVCMAAIMLEISYARVFAFEFFDFTYLSMSFGSRLGLIAAVVLYAVGVVALSRLPAHGGADAASGAA